MAHVAIFVVGVVVGAILGAMLVACLFVGRQADDDSERARFIRWGVSLPEGQFHLEGDFFMLTMTDTKKVNFTIEAVDIHGHPARVDGVPEWGVSDDKLLSLVVAEDGMSALVLAVGEIGVGQVTVTIDADMGAGVRQITGIRDITIVGGEAASIVMTAGAPEEQ